MNTITDNEIDMYLRKPQEMYTLLRKGQELGQINCYSDGNAAWAVQNGILFYVERIEDSNMRVDDTTTRMSIQICPSGVWCISNPYDKHAFIYSPNAPWAAQALPYIRRAFGKLHAKIKARTNVEHVAREAHLRQALASLERLSKSE